MVGLQSLSGTDVLKGVYNYLSLTHRNSQILLPDSFNCSDGIFGENFAGTMRYDESRIYVINHSPWIVSLGLAESGFNKDHLETDLDIFSLPYEQLNGKPLPRIQQIIADELTEDYFWNSFLCATTRGCLFSAPYSNFKRTLEAPLDEELTLMGAINTYRTNSELSRELGHTSINGSSTYRQDIVPMLADTLFELLKSDKKVA